MIELKLPALGADMDEGTLLEWHVHPGDAVHKGDVLAVVDTTKAALDVESWHEGTVWDLVLAIGQKVPVGTLMARLLEPGETPPAAASTPLQRESAAATPAAVAADVTIGGRPAEAATAPAAPPFAGAAPAAASASATEAEAPHVRRPVSPAARRRAAELGVSLASLAGSGLGGAVTLADVERVARTAPAASHPSPSVRDRSADIRRTIASVMSRSKREVPHYYLSEDVPLGRAMDWLRTTNATRPIAERILPAALYVRAVALAALQHPTMNGHFVEGQFRPSAVVNLGVAISLRGGGLLAPAISRAEGKTLGETMRALTDLVARTRAGTLRREEVADPTITLTNLGEQSVRSVQAIIYAPQVAIVGFGSVSDRAWVIDGKVVAIPVVTATLGADHRVSDGHAGARFLAAIAANLQRPEAL